MNKIVPLDIEKNEVIIKKKTIKRKYINVIVVLMIQKI